MTNDLPKNGGNGERDPDWVEIHESACARGEEFYQDPATGYWVTTRIAHLKRGHCCKNGCRHCPWSESR